MHTHTCMHTQALIATRRSVKLPPRQHCCEGIAVCSARCLSSSSSLLFLFSIFTDLPLQSKGWSPLTCCFLLHYQILSLHYQHFTFLLLLLSWHVSPPLRSPLTCCPLDQPTYYLFLPLVSFGHSSMFPFSVLLYGLPPLLILYHMFCRWFLSPFISLILLSLCPRPPLHLLSVTSPSQPSLPCVRLCQVPSCQVKGQQQGFPWASQLAALALYITSLMLHINNSSRSCTS